MNTDFIVVYHIGNGKPIHIFMSSTKFEFSSVLSKGIFPLKKPHHIKSKNF